MPTPEPTRLEERARDDLAFIRATLERSGRFSAVSGKGGVAIGLVGLLAAALASRTTGAAAWLATWLGAAVVAGVFDAAAIAAKARRLDVPALRGVGRRFVFTLAPATAVGALLTPPLYSRGLIELLPPLWLLLYGAGILGAATYSLPVVGLMGLAFLVLGAWALIVPVGRGDLYMALGFGGLNLVFGAVIWRRHGG